MTRAVAEKGREMEMRARWADEAAREDRKDAVVYARHVIGDAANKVGDEAITDIVLPTIDRIIQGGVDLVDLAGHEGKGLVRVLRVSSLGARLRKIGVSDELAAVALRFSRDFEKARIGGLTANYEGGGGSKRACEPERWLEAMERLARASAKLDHDERVAVYGYVLFDVSAADLGAFLCGGLSHDHVNHKFLEKFLLNKSLNKLALFYEDCDWRELNGVKQAKIA
ncbi:hypothetical protein [Asticcacaulis sp.]|uniref:hypothetical protein n=1 Tax=Asticcacaulis sp. TaxID=1872648 RepID=UPI003F7B5FAC